MTNSKVSKIIVKQCDAKQLAKLINETAAEELAILLINLPEIDKEFRGLANVVPLTDNWQVIATTKSTVKSINPKGKSGWFDLLEKYISEEDWELSGDTCDHPIEWYPDIPFYCWFMPQASFYEKATEKAMEILSELNLDKIPECYLHLIKRL